MSNSRGRDQQTEAAICKLIYLWNLVWLRGGQIQFVIKTSQVFSKVEILRFLFYSADIFKENCNSLAVAKISLICIKRDYLESFNLKRQRRSLVIMWDLTWSQTHMRKVQSSLITRLLVKELLRNFPTRLLNTKYWIFS